MTPAKVYLAATGLLTPAGFNAATTAAVVKARLNIYRKSNHVNKDFNAMSMALIPEGAIPPLNPSLEKTLGLTARHRRMLRIATPAANHVMAALTLKRPPPLFLALPESLPNCPSHIEAKFIDHLMLQSGLSIDRNLSRIVATGRSAGLEVIDLAFKYLEISGNDVVLVGGIDSYLDHELLCRLDSDDRILAENIADGFAPGEAAGFLLLVSERVVSKLPRKPEAVLYQPGLANEPGHRYSSKPYLGEGLSKAFKAAIENAGSPPIEKIYASLNGESFGAKEFGIACLRNQAVLSENFITEHPADCFGDIGAAFGPVLISLTVADKVGNYLLYCSSELEARSAIVVSITSDLKNRE